MNRQRRPIGITSLAFVSVMVGIYSQIAAIALLLGGTIVGVAGSGLTAALVILGAVFLGLMAAAYFAGFGFWTQRPWSWAVGNVVFGVLIVASVILALTSSNVLSALGPTLGAAVAIWYLHRPATRAQLLGTGAAEAPHSAPDRAEEPAGSGTLESPQPVR